MHIDQIDVYHVAMPMKETWRTAFSEMDRIDSVMVRLVAEGFVGWGEAAPYAAPNYCPEFASGAFAVIRDWLAPAILGREIPSGETLHARFAPFKGNQFAKAAIDIGVLTYRFIRKYVDRRPPLPLTLRQVDPLIRQLTLYRALIDHKTGDPT